MMDDGREDQLPWTRWFWADWDSDVGLRSCGLAAQGLWMRMLSIMARSKRKGYLLDGDKPMESKTLAKIVGEEVALVDTLIDELFSHGVPSRDGDGTIYNRRMARESALSDIRSMAGRLGGRPKKQTESKTKATVKQDVKANPASASSINMDLSLKSKKEEILAVAEAWNSLAMRSGLPTIQGIAQGTARHRALLVRMEQKNWNREQLLTLVEQSSFLTGKKTSFRATFDWIINASNYQKIIEGNYADSPKDNPTLDFNALQLAALKGRG